MTASPRELAAQGFSKGDRVETGAGRTGVVHDVNTYAAAIVTVRFDDDRMRLSPCLYFSLTNLSRQAR
jgi:preprotein translocase subunit YajC